ncbi:beta-lactamase/transpeptidase-like protein [Hyaloscypha bicolor E]|uniref:Beta-lactamase/transpeptidase-like protein n=1 Tax=Hyaloscypha bicolor E TaxID=1095630 RepID=A0A2J6T5W8_9HELO|nr:beta-lactamase/transpeptidase-like protein [Hyaloscypha bicolor E]PMD58412.1 beta-lactamase/transpeptidase-like protein [Hyaloscypha bicolor E]
MEAFELLREIIKHQFDNCASSEAALATLGSPSTSIGILDDAEISSHCIATEGHNQDTLFQACSISKPVACVSAAILVQQGKLSFDDKIAALLPISVMEVLETPSTKHLLGEITIRMLMSHTSGLSQHAFPGYTSNIPSPLDVLAGKGGINTKHVHLEGLPGHRFSYSGGGMTVLQLILEHITNQAFPDLVRELVLDPLSMHRSFYAIPQEENYAIAQYTGFTACEVPYRANPEQAAAGLWTTPTDLLKLVRALQRSLRVNDHTGLLHKEVAQEMLTEISGTMAMGWFAPREPGIAFGHGGSNEPGWRCFLVGYANLDFGAAKDWNAVVPILDTDCGIAVMTNSAAGIDICFKVVNAIAYIKGWSSIPYWYGNPVVTIPFALKSHEIDDRWVRWIGIWSNGWEIEEGAESQAMARFRNLSAIKLIAAAMPAMKHPKMELNMVLEGLAMMMSFQEQEGELLVVLWDGGSETKSTLRRVK